MVDQLCNGTQLYLASNSPRRRELMALAEWEYEVVNPQVDETPLPGESGIAYVQRLARWKAEAAAGKLPAGGLIVAADTTVADPCPNGRATIMGKPADQDEARAMLRRLRGHSHQVHTAISVLSVNDGTQVADICTTHVPMRDYTDQEIDTYVASGDPMDKAGAYAIQHLGFHPVEKLEGCFANVMGLPLCHLTRSLVKLGLNPRSNIPQACQSALSYHCPVYSLILKDLVQGYTWG